MLDTNLEIYAAVKLLIFFLQARTPPAGTESSVHSLSVVALCIYADFAGVYLAIQIGSAFSSIVRCAFTPHVVQLNYTSMYSFALAFKRITLTSVPTTPHVFDLHRGRRKCVDYDYVGT